MTRAQHSPSFTSLHPLRGADRLAQEQQTMSSQNNRVPSASSSSRKGLSALLQFASSRINLGWLTPFLGKPVLGSGRVATPAATSALSAGAGAKQCKWRASLLGVAFFSVLLSPAVAQAQVCTPGSFTWSVTKFGSHFDTQATVDRLFDGQKAYAADQALRMHHDLDDDLIIAFSSARPVGSTVTLFMENSDAEGMAAGDVTTVATSYQNTYRVGGTAPNATLFALLDRDGNGTIQSADYNVAGATSLNQSSGDYAPLGVTLSFFNGATLVNRAYSPLLTITTSVYSFTGTSTGTFDRIVVQSWADNHGRDPRVIEVEVNGAPNNGTNTITTTCLQLIKAWGANAIAGNVASIGATTGGANNTSAFTSTASTNASSTSVAVAVGNTITFPAETMPTGSLANYNAVRSCTSNGGATTNALSNTNGKQTGTLLIGAGDAGKSIVCTYTNTRRTANLTLGKTWVNAKVNDAVTITGTGLTALNSVANTASETDTAAPQTVLVGDVITFAETFTTGNADNYNTSLSCINSNGVVLAGLRGNVFTVGTGGVNISDISCTYTNTRKTASLTLAKTWSNATVNDAVNITATGLTTLASVANTASETDTAAAQTVRAGDVITIAENFTTGSAANYNSTLTCTGTSGLAGNVLTVGSADTAITCTYSNTGKTATLTLAKAWNANVKAGDVASIGATTGGTNNTAAFNSTALTNSSSTTANVSVGNVITLPAETMTTGLLANYNTVLSCTANGGPTANPLSGTNGQVANTLVIGAGDADKDVVCTYTNTRKTANLTLRKTWVNAKLNDALEFTATGLTPLVSVANTTSETDAAAAQTVYAGDDIELEENFTTGVAGNYTSVLACAGNTVPLAGNVLTVNAADTAVTCTYTNTRKSTGFRLAKAWGPGSSAGNVASIGPTTGLENNTALFTSTAPTNTNGTIVPVFFSGETATLPLETMSPGTLANYNTVISCNAGTLSGTNGQVAGNTITVGPADVSTNPITCTYTNTPVALTLQLSKAWGPNSIAGNVASIGATTGGSNNTAPFTSTASTNVSSAAVSVTVGNTITFPAETMPTGTLANYNTVLSCLANGGPTANALSGTNGQQTNTLLIGIGDANKSINCTYTNTRKTISLTLRKTWVNAIVNNAVSITATGRTPLASVANTASETDTGAVQTVRAGDVITFAETFTTGSAANYNSTLSCTGTSGLVGNVLTVGSADANIVCTYTNTRKTANLTLRKTWANAIVNNAVNITATGLSPLASVANTASETDTGAVQTVRAGDVITFAETFTTGSAANYNSTLTCTGTSGLAGNVLTIGSADTNIVCTYTNTRKTASLTLAKTWSNAAVNDAVNITATGLSPLASVANTANETDTGAVQTVRAGDQITLAETFTSGSAANYSSSLSCTGNATPLAGSVLTVSAADSAITCTYTNTRAAVNLTLVKTWVNALVGDEVNISGTGLSPLTSSVNTGTETDTGSAQVVLAGDVITLSESFSNGSATNYNTTLSCTGTSGLSGSTLTVGSGDTNITCAYTNTRKTANLSLSKSWVSALVGDEISFTATGLTPLSSSVDTGTEVDTGSAQTVRAGDVITLAEAFTNGDSDNYTSALSCTGNTTPLAGNALTVNAADTAITCTYTNTRKTASLTLRKTWVNAIVGNQVSVNAEGLSSLSSTANTASETDVGAAQTVQAGDAISLVEIFTSGDAANYDVALSCTGNNTPLSVTDDFNSVLNVNSADTAVVCTFTNTRKSTTFRLAKAWGVGSIAGNVASIGATTGLINNTTLFTSTASTATNGTAVTVFAGETATLPVETMTTGTLADYNTVISCNAGTLTGTNGQVAGNTVAIGAADVTTNPITCTYTNLKLPTVTLTKVSNGSVGPFNFPAGTNGWASQTITTTAQGVGVAGATQTLAAASTQTDISETLPAGYTLSSISCSGLGSGGSATPNLTGTAVGGIPAHSVRLDAAATAAGSTIDCTFTNTLSTVDLAITKTNTLGVNGNVDQANDTLVRGQTTSYDIVVTNNGPQSVTGAVVTDPAVAGLTCTGLTCTGAACPSATPAVSVLQTGLTLGTLAVGSANAVTLKLNCNVN